MIMNRIRIFAAFAAIALLLAACGQNQDIRTATQPQEGTTEVSNPEPAEETPAPEAQETPTPSAEETPTPSEDKDEDEEPGEEVKKNDKDVDLIFFMGQSNMSGAAGDPSAAPYVSPDAGEEFRAVSDPTRLYPITEPFGVNENNPSGISEYPGAKKGSLVSAFVNKYHELTGRKVIAVSMSKGATFIGDWTTPGVLADVSERFEKAKNYLRSNGYTIGHMYVVWLHGESDGIKGTDPAVYGTGLDDLMRPFFIGGLQKVFIIMPGRTIDYRDILLPIINEQMKICGESGYYAVATTILTRVSTEYMRDQYHYNQHVLNLVGIKAAESVAYYTNHNEEMIVYDYKNGGYIVPEGVDEESAQREQPLRLEDLNIDEIY